MSHCIQACCKEAWIQAAVLLSNVEQHVLSIGLNLDLCTLFFTAQVGFEGVHGAEFEGFNKVEAEIVREQAAMNTEFAMKTFYGPSTPDFHREVSTLSKLSHPNITSLLCAKADKRKCSTVIRLMDGDLFTFDAFKNGG